MTLATETDAILPTRVIVAHSMALVSAGLAAILATRGGWDVRTWDDADERYALPRTTGQPILVGDAAMLDRLSGQLAGARVVLLSQDDAGSQEHAKVDAKLTPACSPADLIGAVDRLCAAESGPSRHVASPPRGGLAPCALRKVREHIAQRLAERIEIRDLAAIAGLSACHFARAFRESTGVPPHRYVTELRLATAAAQVRDTARSLTEIAYDVGFFDLSHFSRQFARAFGEAPSAYRARYRQ